MFKNVLNTALMLYKVYQLYQIYRMIMFIKSVRTKIDGENFQNADKGGFILNV